MSSTLTLYVVIGLIAVALAIFLSYFATLSAQPRDKREKKLAREKAVYAKPGPVQGDLKEAIFDELGAIVESPEHRQHVAKVVSDIFNRELEKNIDVNKRELSKKYESIIEQKAEGEQLAWKKYRKVLAEKEETAAVVRSIAEGLVVVDSEGKVIMMNPAAERLLGVSAKEKMGKPVSDGLKDEQLVSLAKGSADKGEREIELISKQDETKKVLRASSAVIEDEDGKTVGMVSVLSDITKQKELEQMKSNFVASVSHELRTPLVAMEKSITLILSKAAGEISADQEQFLGIAERNLKRLSSLINDLLDLSKLEAGKMQLQRQPYSVEKVINEALEGFANWAKTKSIKIERNIKEGLPEVNIDSNRIIQVFNNLIGNAIKFTPANGTITLAARMRAEERAVEVSVQDSGIGITPENLAKIFNKFFQVGERNPTDISGTGIGLSIAKEIVQLHGGKIWAESEHGQGAKFTFTLPL